MFRRIHTLMSLANLTRCHFHLQGRWLVLCACQRAGGAPRRMALRGQIATFLLLMIVVLLIMAIATANIGHLATDAAQAATGVDGAVLSMASQLATISHGYWEQLGQREETCSPAGIFLLIIAFMFAGAMILDIFGFGQDKYEPMTDEQALNSMLGLPRGNKRGEDPELRDKFKQWLMRNNKFDPNTKRDLLKETSWGSHGFAFWKNYMDIWDAYQEGRLAEYMGKRLEDPMVRTWLFIPLALYAGIQGFKHAKGNVFQKLGTAFVTIAQFAVREFLIQMGHGINFGIYMMKGMGRMLLGAGNLVINDNENSARHRLFSYLDRRHNIPPDVAKKAINAGFQMALAITAAIALVAIAILFPFTAPAGTSVLGLFTVTAGSLAHVVLVTLALAGLAATIYNINATSRALSRGYSVAEKLLSGLPQKDRIQQGAIQMAMSQMVDDPTFVPDPENIELFEGALTVPGDIDGDGKVNTNSNDQVPAFALFWTRHLLEIKASREDAAQQTTDFLNTMTGFADTVEPTYTFECEDVCVQEDTDGPCSKWDRICTSIGFLVRAWIEGAEEGVRGLLEEVGTRLELGAGGRQDYVTSNTDAYPLEFWQSGPPKNVLDAWLKCDDCSACNCDPPVWAGFSEEDMAIFEFQGFVEKTRALQAQDKGVLALTWKEWVGDYFDRDTDEEWFDTFQVLIDAMQRWRGELDTIRKGLSKPPLPECEDAAPADGLFDNAPCRIDATGFATVDPDAQDEFAQLDQFIAKLLHDSTRIDLSEVRPPMEDYFDVMAAIDAAAAAADVLGGLNPVEYTWTDSRGEFTVTGEAGDFAVPFVHKRRKGGFWNKKYCLELEHGAGDGKTVWVEVSKVNPQAGMRFWTWYPGPQGENVVTKRSCARYTPTFVGFDACTGTGTGGGGGGKGCN